MAVVAARSGTRRRPSGTRWARATSPPVEVEHGTARAPAHDRGDDVARAGRIVVEASEYVPLGHVEPHLLSELAAGGLRRPLLFVRAPAGNRPLPAVAPQPRSAPRQYETRLAGFAADDHERHRRPPHHGAGLHPARLDGGEPLLDPRPQGGVERKRGGAGLHDDRTLARAARGAAPGAAVVVRHGRRAPGAVRKVSSMGRDVEKRSGLRRMAPAPDASPAEGRSATLEAGRDDLGESRGLG